MSWFCASFTAWAFRRLLWILQISSRLSVCFAVLHNVLAHFEVKLSNLCSKLARRGWIFVSRSSLCSSFIFIKSEFILSPWIRSFKRLSFSESSNYTLSEMKLLLTTPQQTREHDQLSRGSEYCLGYDFHDNMLLSLPSSSRSCTFM